MVGSTDSLNQFYTFQQKFLRLHAVGLLFVFDKLLPSGTFAHQNSQFSNEEYKVKKDFYRFCIIFYIL